MTAAVQFFFRQSINQSSDFSIMSDFDEQDSPFQFDIGIEEHLIPLDFSSSGDELISQVAEPVLDSVEELPLPHESRFSFNTEAERNQL